MRTRRGTSRLAVAAVVVVSLALAGCADASESSDAGGDPAATLEETKAPDGTELHRITLSEGAVERVGIRLDPIVAEAGGLLVPYSAVVYDPDGTTWVYTRPKARTFLRAPVTVARIEGELAHLSAGPDAGTGVVTLGTAELYGAEQEIGA
jgi:hypothetical protein